MTARKNFDKRKWRKGDDLLLPYSQLDKKLDKGLEKLYARQKCTRIIIGLFGEEIREEIQGRSSYTNLMSENMILLNKIGNTK